MAIYTETGGPGADESQAPIIAPEGECQEFACPYLSNEHLVTRATTGAHEADDFADYLIAECKKVGSCALDSTIQEAQNA